MRPRLTMAVTVRAAGAASFDGRLEVEWNFNLSGGGGNPSAYYRSADGETRHDAAGTARPGTALSFGNEYEGVDIAAQAAPPAEIAWRPVETVSNSEAGFERTYQGSCLTFSWPLTVAPGEEHSFEIALAVTQTRDRAATEAP